MKKVDWLTADMQGLSQMDTLADYYQDGNDPKDFTLLSSDEYWEKDEIKNAFIDESGEPNKEIFDQYYNLSKKRYIDFKNEEYDRLSLKSIQTRVYDTPITRRAGLDTFKSPVQLTSKNEDPYGISVGLTGMGSISEPTRSLREAASRYVMNTETGELERYEDVKWDNIREGKIFKVALDENGRPKIFDGNGQPYLETQDSSEELSPGDIQIGRFDDMFGGLHGMDETALQTATRFIPRTLANTVASIVEGVAELGKSVTAVTLGKDSDPYAAFTSMGNQAASYKPALSDRGSTSFLDDPNFENISNLAGNVFFQLYTGGLIGRATGLASYPLLRSLAGAERGAAMASGLGVAMSKTALSVMAAGEIAKSARENGLSDGEAMAVHAAMLIGLYNINKLSEPLLGGISNITAHRAVQEAAKSAFSISKGAGPMTTNTAMAMGRRFLATLEKGLTSSSILGDAGREATEEVLEQVLDIGIRTGFNWYANDREAGQGRFGDIDAGEEWKAILESAIGGALGGAMGGVAQLGGRRDDQKKAIQQYVMDGKSDEVKAALRKLHRQGALGPRHISAKDGRPLEEGSTEMNVNDLVLEQAIGAINVLERTYKSLGIKDIEDSTSRAIQEGRFEEVFSLTSLRDDLENITTEIAESTEDATAITKAQERLSEIQEGVHLARYLEEGLYNFHHKGGTLTGRGFNQLNESVIEFRENSKIQYENKREQASKNIERALKGEDVEVLEEDKKRAIEEYEANNTIESVRSSLVPDRSPLDNDLINDIDSGAISTLEDLYYAMMDFPSDMVEEVIPEVDQMLAEYSRIRKLKTLPEPEDMDDSIDPLLYSVQDVDGDLTNGVSLERQLSQEEKATNNDTYTNIEGVGAIKDSIELRRQQVIGLLSTQDEVNDYALGKGLDQRLWVEPTRLEGVLEELDKLYDRAVRLESIHKSREGDRDLMQRAVDGRTLKKSLNMLSRTDAFLKEQGVVEHPFFSNFEENFTKIEEALGEMDLVEARRLITSIEVDLHNLLKTNAKELYDNIDYKNTRYSIMGGKFLDSNYELFQYLKKIEVVHPALFFKEYSKLLDNMDNVSSMEQEESVRAGLSYVLDKKMLGRAKLLERIEDSDIDISNAFFLEGYQGTGKTNQVLAIMAKLAQNMGSGKVLGIAHRDIQKDNLLAALSRAGVSLRGNGSHGTVDSLVEQMRSVDGRQAIKTALEDTEILIVDEATHVDTKTMANLLTAIDILNKVRSVPIKVVLAGDTTQSGAKDSEGFSDNLSWFLTLHRSAPLTMPFRTGSMDILYAVDFFREGVESNRYADSLDVIYDDTQKKGLNVKEDQEEFDNEVRSIIEKATKDGELDEILYITDKPKSVPGINPGNVGNVVDLQGREAKYVIIDLEGSEYTRIMALEKQNAKDLLTAVSRSKQYVLMRSYGSRPIRSVRGNPIMISAPVQEGRKEAKKVEIDTIVREYPDVKGPASSTVKGDQTVSGKKAPELPKKGPANAPKKEPDLVGIDESEPDIKFRHREGNIYMRPFTKTQAQVDNPSLNEIKKKLLYQSRSVRGKSEYYLQVVSPEVANTDPRYKQVNGYRYTEPTVFMMGKVTGGKDSDAAKEVMLGVMDYKFGKPGENIGNKQFFDELASLPSGTRLSLEPSTVLSMLESRNIGGFVTHPVYNKKKKYTLKEARESQTEMVMSNRVYITAEDIYDQDGKVTDKAGRPFVFYSSDLSLTPEQVDNMALQGKHKRLGRMMLDTPGNSVERLMEIFTNENGVEDADFFLSDNIRTELASVVMKLVGTKVADDLIKSRAIIKLSDEAYEARKKTQERTGKKDRYVSQYVVHGPTFFRILNMNYNSSNPEYRKAAKELIDGINNHPSFKEGLYVTPARSYAEVRQKVSDIGGFPVAYMVAKPLRTVDINDYLIANIPDFSPGVFALDTSILNVDLTKGPDGILDRVVKEKGVPKLRGEDLTGTITVSQTNEKTTMGDIVKSLSEFNKRDRITSLQVFADRAFLGTYNTHLNSFIRYFKRNVFDNIIDRKNAVIETDANIVVENLNRVLNSTIINNVEFLNRMKPSEILGYSGPGQDQLHEIYYAKIAFEARDFLLEKYFGIEFDTDTKKWRFVSNKVANPGSIIDNKETMNLASDGVSKYVKTHMENIPSLNYDPETNKWYRTGKYLGDKEIGGHRSLVELFSNSPKELNSLQAEREYLEDLMKTDRDPLVASYYKAIHDPNPSIVDDEPYHSLTYILKKEGNLNLDMVKALSSAVGSFVVKDYAGINVDDGRVTADTTGSSSRGYTKNRFKEGFSNTAFTLNPDRENDPDGMKYIPNIDPSTIASSNMTAMEKLQELGLPIDRRVYERYIEKYRGSDHKAEVLANKLLEKVAEGPTNDPVGDLFEDMVPLIRAYEDERGSPDSLVVENMEGEKVYLLNQKSPLYDVNKWINKIRDHVESGKRSVHSSNPFLKGYDIRGIYLKDGIRGYNSDTRTMIKRPYSQMTQKELSEVSINWLYSDVLLRNKGRQAILDFAVFADKSTQPTALVGDRASGTLIKAKDGDVDLEFLMDEYFSSQRGYYTTLQEIILARWENFASTHPDMYEVIRSGSKSFPKTLARLNEGLKKITQLAGDGDQRALYFIDKIAQSDITNNLMVDPKSNMVSQQLVDEVKMYASSQGLRADSIRKDFENHMLGIDGKSGMYGEFIDSLYNVGFDVHKGSLNRLGDTYFPKGMKNFRNSNDLRDHPVLKHYFWQWNTLANGLNTLMTGSVFQYKGSDIDSKYGDQVKRNHMSTSGFQYFVLNSGEDRSGLGRTSKVVTIKEPIAEITDILSNNKLQEINDGASFVTKLTRIKQHNSLGGDFGFGAIGNIKPITTSRDIESGEVLFIKNAEFEINSETLREGTDMERNMARSMLREPFPDNSTGYTSALHWLETNYGENWWDHGDGVWYSLHEFLVENDLQDTPIDEVAFPSSQKTGARNVIPMEDFFDERIPTVYRDVSNENKGVMLNAMYDLNDSKEIAQITQMFSAMANEGRTLGPVKEVYDALSVLAHKGIWEMDNKTKKDFRGYVKKSIKGKVLSEDREGSLQQMVLNDNFSLSDKKILNMVVSDLNSNISKNTIEVRMGGGQLVVSPANGRIKVVDTRQGDTTVPMMRSDAESRGIPFDNPRDLKWNEYINPETKENLFDRDEYKAFKQAIASGDQELINNTAAALREVMSQPGWVVTDAEVIMPNIFVKEFGIPVGESLQNIYDKGADYFLEQMMQGKEGLATPTVGMQRKAEKKFNDFKKAMEVFAARIPGTGKHSGVNMKVVGFIDSTYNSMYVPVEMLYIQGADQDIDKGNVQTFVTDSKMEINIPDTVNPNTEVPHIINYVLDRMRKVFGAPVNAIEANVPVSTDSLKEIAANRVLPVKAHHNNPFSIPFMYNANMQGKQLIGVFAQALKTYSGIYYAARTGDVSFGEPFEFMGKTYEGLANMRGDDGKQAWIAFAELINAATDNAKELILGKIGANTETANIISMLTATGVPANDIFEYLLSEPVQEVFGAIERSKEYDGGFPKNLRSIGEGDGISEDAKEAAVYLGFLDQRAKEYGVLAKMFNLNQGLPNGPYDVHNFHTGLEADISNLDAWPSLDTKFSLERFVKEPEYREWATKFMEPRFVNPLDVIQKVPHMWKYLQVAVYARDRVRKTSFVIREVDSILEKARQITANAKGELRKSSEIEYRQATNYIYGLAVDKHLRRIKKSVSIDGVRYDLWKINDRDKFMKSFPGYISRIAKNSDNEFLKSLGVRSHNFLGKDYVILASSHDIVNIDEETDIALRAAVDNLDSDHPGMNLKDLLYTYSLISEKGGLSKNSFAKVFPASMDAEFHITLEDIESGKLSIHADPIVLLANSSSLLPRKLYRENVKPIRDIMEKYNFNSIPYSSDGFIETVDDSGNRGRVSIMDLQGLLSTVDSLGGPDGLLYILDKARESLPEKEFRELRESVEKVAKDKGIDISGEYTGSDEVLYIGNNVDVPFQKTRVVPLGTRRAAGKRFGDKLMGRVIDHMNKVIPGVNVQRLSSSELMGINPNLADKMGAVIGDTIYLNDDLMEIDTPIHEYGHLWMRYVNHMFPEQYSIMMDSVEDTDALREVQELYPELSLDQQKEEAFIELLGKHVGNRLALKYEDQSWWAGLNRAVGDVIRYIREALRSLFGMDGEYYLDVSPEMSLEDILDQVSSQIEEGDRLFNREELSTLRNIIRTKDGNFDSSLDSSKLALLKDRLIRDGIISIEC